MDTFCLTGTVVVSDQRTHSLDDSICRKIQEGLKLVIDSEHHHVNLGVGGENPIQCGDKQGWKCHIQSGRDSNRVKPSGHGTIYVAAFMNLHRKRSGKIKGKVQYQCDNLTKTGCKCGSFNSHFRERSDSEDQKWIQYDIENTSAHHADHGHAHPSDCLKNFFPGNFKRDYNGKSKCDPGVGISHLNNGHVFCKNL